MVDRRRARVHKAEQAEQVEVTGGGKADEGELNEDVRRSRLVISRRRALSLGGTIALGSLLAACTSDEASSTRAARGSASPVGTPIASPSSTPLPTAAITAADSDLVAALDAARTCSPTPEQTEGPFWFDVDSIRTDIREDRPGPALELAFRVHDVSACSDGGQAVPVSNAVVEIWHCDAGGRYSGFESGSAGRGGGTSDGDYSVGDREAAPSDDGTYLRGAQVADRNGIVQFTTIFPGWYRGRTAHVHLKVHVSRESVLSTQVYVPDEVAEQVYALDPYRDHTGRDTYNADDFLFSDDAVLTVSQVDDRHRGLINLGIAL